MSGVLSCKYCTFRTADPQELQDHELSHEGDDFLEDEDQEFQTIMRRET